MTFTYTFQIWHAPLILGALLMFVGLARAEHASRHDLSHHGVNLTGAVEFLLGIGLMLGAAFAYLASRWPQAP